MTALLSPAGEALLNAGHLAHLVTLEPGGAPQVSCVWVGLDDGEVVFGSMGPRRKIENIRRDERVSLSIESGHRNDYGLDEYLVLHGRARVVDGGGRGLLQRLAHTYLGPDVVFPDPSIPGDGMVVRIAIDRVSGVGPWTPTSP